MQRGPDEESMELSDFKKLYDNNPQPYLYSSVRFVYKNKAQMIHDGEVEKARVEYEIERAKHPPGPFDAIGAPSILGICGDVGPLYISDEIRPKLISYCNLALDQYNDQNQDADFVFHDLIKSTYGSCPGGMYYITFQAKPKECSNSDIPAITFQAQVWGRCPRGTGPPEVMSCAIKPT